MSKKKWVKIKENLRQGRNLMGPVGGMGEIGVKTNKAREQMGELGNHSLVGWGECLEP
jgi:hypothetical protein